MRRLRVLRAGLKTTVEDLGRKRVAIWGVPKGGAFDAQALAAANLLVGNEESAAGLELTLQAPELEALQDLDVAYVGADFGLSILENGSATELPTGRAVRLAAGARLAGGYAKRGSRGWLAIGGGVDVPAVLGSRSTELGAGFGGYHGHPLAAGNVVPIAEPLFPPSRARYRDPVSLDDAAATLRVLPGPQADAMPAGFRDALEALELEVARDSDRTGVRLTRVSGPELPSGWPAEIEPEGTVDGAVQLPGDGDPIVLGVDGPTTGGYAKPVVVIRADIGLLARLAPAMRVRLRHVTIEEARAAAAVLRARLEELQA